MTLPKPLDRGVRYFRRSPIIWVGWGLLTLPLCFLGPGSDSDSFLVITTIKTWLSTGVYHPSRNPGFPIFEGISTLIYAQFGILGITIATLIISVITLIIIEKIIFHLGNPHARWITACVALNPLFWVNATCVIDYNWALFFLSIALYAWQKGQQKLMIIATALAIGCRITAGLFPISLIIYSLIQRYRTSSTTTANTPLITTGIVSGLLGALLYIPSWISAGKTFQFLKAGTTNIGNWRFLGHLSRFVYKNIYFFGIFATFYILYLMVIKFQKRHKSTQVHHIEHSQMIMISLLMIALSELLYFRYPYENEYLLPLLPFEAILLSMGLFSKRQLMTLTVAIASYAVISIPIAKPDVPNQASTAKISLSIEQGYVLMDSQKRLNHLWLPAGPK